MKERGGIKMKKYYSVDVELSGRQLGVHSMISLGACIVRDGNSQFYREIKPRSFAYEKPAMRVASMGLECLTLKLRKTDFYDPQHRFFRPELVLRLLSREGVAPIAAMNDFLTWINQTKGEEEPILLAKPVRVDVPFIHWYLKEFCGNLGCLTESGVEDLEQSYRELVQRNGASLRELEIQDTRSALHNALDDAVYQALQFEKILELRKAN
jgi:hypothetical protein